MRSCFKATDGTADAAIVDAARGEVVPRARSAILGVANSLAFMAGLRLKFILISPPPAPLVIGAAWIEKRPLSPAARLFLNCAVESSAKLE